MASSDQVASVQVTFQVEQSIRGARAGEKLTFLEWAGLWSAGARYRVGQHLMPFLYAPSALGLTCPVGGAAGRFFVDRSGRVVLSQIQQQAIRVLPASIRIDTRRPLSLRDFARAIQRMDEE